MASFNQVILLGNLTRDPELRYIPGSNTPVVDFGLATNRRWRTEAGEDREEVTFVDCSAFGKMAEIINEHCRKGKALFVQGRLRLDQWEDKQGGGKRSKLSVIIENFQFVGAKSDGGGDGGGGDRQRGGWQDRGPATPTATRAQQNHPQQPRGGPAPQRSAGAPGRQQQQQQRPRDGDGDGSGEPFAQREPFGGRQPRGGQQQQQQREEDTGGYGSGDDEPYEPEGNMRGRH